MTAALHTLAQLLGLVGVFALMYGLHQFLERRQRTREADDDRRQFSEQLRVVPGQKGHSAQPHA